MGSNDEVFKNAVDIMLFKGLKEDDPDVQQKLAEIMLQEEEEKRRRLLEEKALEESNERSSARDSMELTLKIPSASEARNKTLKQIRDNAHLVVKKEATEILQMAMKAIEYAISEEKFRVELGGPGRPDPGPIILRQAFANYHEDARKVVVKRLEEQGYKVELADNICLKISW